MSDMIRDRVLEEALAEIPQKGFSEGVLSAAGARAGISKRELQDAFPAGPEVSSRRSPIGPIAAWRSNWPSSLPSSACAIA